MLNTSISISNYTPRYTRNPSFIDNFIFNSDVTINGKKATLGTKAIAAVMYAHYFNRRQASENNVDFYDLKHHDYYIIFENKEFMSKKSLGLNSNAVSAGKAVLKNLKLIDPDQQPWNRPDRIYINDFNNIYDSMTTKKSSFSHTNRKTSGDLKNQSLLRKKKTTKIKLNKINTKSNTKITRKSQSKSKTESKIFYAQKINQWIYATANRLCTPGVSKSYAKDLTTTIARMANKDYKQARHLFHVITSWWKNIQSSYNIGKYQRVGIEKISGLYDKLKHIYSYQLDPTYKKVSLKRYIGYITNALRKFYVQCAYHLKDSLDPYYFNQAKMAVGAKVEHPDNRPAAINNEPMTKGPRIPIFKV